MTPQPSEQPRTAAGRALLDDWTWIRPDHPANTVKVRDRILAIEAEAAAPDPVASPLNVNIEADGSISRISGGPLEQPVYTKGTVGPFWDEIEAWRDGYRAGLSEAKRRATAGEGTPE